MGSFTSYLKKYRLLAGLTQEELAEQVDVRRETIVRLEAGRYNPSLKLAIDIARAVQAPIEDIFVFERAGAEKSPRRPVPLGAQARTYSREQPEGQGRTV